MEQRRKNLTQLFIPICLETLLYMQEKDVKLEQEAVSILCYNTRRE